MQFSVFTLKCAAPALRVFGVSASSSLIMSLVHGTPFRVFHMLNSKRWIIEMNLKFGRCISNATFFHFSSFFCCFFFIQHFCRVPVEVNLPKLTFGYEKKKKYMKMKNDYESVRCRPPWTTDKWQTNFPAKPTSISGIGFRQNVSLLNPDGWFFLLSTSSFWLFKE